MVVATFYKFTSLNRVRARQEALQSYCEQRGVRGTILLSKEGINATIAGSHSQVEAVLAYLRLAPCLTDLKAHMSFTDTCPFYLMRVRVKKESLSLGIPEADPQQRTGRYVPPEQWNDLITDPAVTVVDARNDYEIRIGSFQGAQQPNIHCFREFPRYVQERLNPEEQSKIALFCTGGVRCEKASALLLNRGFENVYQLEGGILRYLEKVPASDSLWKGDCFVFDQRVALDHALKPSNYKLCYSCRQPLAPETCLSPQYKEGISCPYCFDILTAVQKAGRRQRHYQIELARKRNRPHLGSALKRQGSDKKG